MREKLLSLKDEKYREFNSKLLPNIDNVLGVRVPDLRKLAKELSKGDWQNYKDNLYYEEIMIQGLVIGYAKLEPKNRLELLRKFIPKVDNWATCDIVCSNLKFIKQNKELVWEFIQPYLNSDKEFEIRFGVVILLNYFVEDEYIDRVLSILDKIKHDGYYAKMAVAWALSVCFVKYWDKTFEYFKKSNLGKWTYNKTIQKTCESYRIPQDKKNLLKNERRAAD